MTTSFDPDCLRCFVAVADQGGFTAAGEKLGLSQSAVSMRIAKLEARAGVRLLDRDPRHVALTAAGQTLLDYARRLIALEAEARTALGRPQPRGRLRLGITEHFIPRHLPHVLAAFVERHPGVDLDVRAGISGELRAMVAAGDLDLAVVRREPAAPGGERLLREALLWVAGADFRLPPPDRPLPLVTLAPPCGVRALAIGALEKAGRAWTQVYVGGSAASQRAAIEAGLGLGAMGWSAVDGPLRVLGHRDGLPYLPANEIMLIHGRARGAAVQAMAAALRAQAGARRLAPADR